MGVYAGITTPLSARDLRNGSFRDLAHLKDKLRSVASMETAIAGGHAPATFQKGTTGNYTGQTSAALWSLRAASDFIDPRAPQQATLKFKSRQSTKAEITTYCISHKLDPNSGKDRAKAGKALAGERLQEWREQANNEEATPAEIDEDSVMSPAEKASLTSLITRPDEQDEEVLEVRAVELLLSEGEGAASQSLLLSPNQFVDYFSRINTVAISNKSATWVPDTVDVGNTRDPPTRFMYRCKNRPHGCSFEEGRAHMVVKHQNSCKISAANPKVPPVKCNQCGKEFSSSDRLEVHVNKVHDWTPQCCPEDDCNDATQFSSAKEMENHMVTMHETPKLAGFTCLYPGCTRTKPFLSKDMLRGHLGKTHGLKADGYVQYLPSWMSDLSRSKRKEASGSRADEKRKRRKTKVTTDASNDA